MHMTKPCSIDAAVRRLRRALRGLDHPPLGQSTALAEECGEVAKLLLDHHAYGKALDQQKLAGELADVFTCLAEIATQHNIVLGEAVANKTRDLAQRANKWRKELGPALARSRRVGAQATTAAGRRSKSK